METPSRLVPSVSRRLRTEVSRTLPVDDEIPDRVLRTEGLPVEDRSSTYFSTD